MYIFHSTYLYRVLLKEAQCLNLCAITPQDANKRHKIQENENVQPFLAQILSKILICEQRCVSLKAGSIDDKYGFHLDKLEIPSEKPERRNLQNSQSSNGHIGSQSELPTCSTNKLKIVLNLTNKYVLINTDQINLTINYLKQDIACA